MFQRLFAARVQDLWCSYEATGELEHPGEKGLLREFFLRRVIESVLPHQFGVGSGVVVDAWERQSPQIDLIIYDKRRFPPLLEEHGHGLYPMDAVLRLIEVKSSLTRRGLEQFGTSVKAFDPKNPNGLKISAPPWENQETFYPFVSLFAYKSEIKNILDVMRNIPDFEGTTNLICIATKRLYFNGNTNALPDRSLEDNLSNFLFELLNQLEASAKSRAEFNVFSWMLR